MTDDAIIMGFLIITGFGIIIILLIHGVYKKYQAREDAELEHFELVQGVGIFDLRELPSMTDDEAESIVFAFAKSLEDNNDLVLNVNDLPASKPIIYYAFDRTITRYEDLRGRDLIAFGKHGWDDKMIEMAKALRIRISDFQIIDDEDKYLVQKHNQLRARIKAGEIDWASYPDGQKLMRESLELCHKYLKRSMSESNSRRGMIS